MVTKKDEDWTDKINRLKGQPFGGVSIESDGKSVALCIGANRWFVLSGEGQRHSYTIEGEPSGTFIGVETLRCTRYGNVATYRAVVNTSGGTLALTATRDSETPEGMRFAFSPERRVPAPKTPGKPSLPIRI
jgi:hypothetical protein